MKKITLLVSAFIVSLSFVGIAPSASAQQACQNQVITNTGAGSENTIVCADNVELYVECENNTYVLDQSSQEALSGQATIGNTANGGSAQTGTATNENDQTVVIGSQCGEAAGTGTGTTPTTPTTPGTGSTTPTPTPSTSVPTAAPKQAVKALPYTAGNDTFVVIAASIVTAIVAFVASRFGVAAYRRAQLNK